MSFTIKSLQGLSIRQIADVFNDACSDYVIPIKLTEEILTAKILSENIQLENSVGVFDNDKLIAFILIGIDEYDGHIVAYNAGTGVIPSYRGNKLTKRMYQYLFPLLKDKDIVSHQLEVITTNTIA